MNRKRLALAAVAVALGCAMPAGAEDIALSLVHKADRVDIPLSAIRRIEAHAPAANETRQPREFSLPHVEVCFTAAIRKGICRLTQHSVDEPMEIVAGCRLVSKPVVREPLCTQPCFHISVNDIAEAEELAQALRTGTALCTSPTS
jgi:preprotein translocase subunit SecD